MIQGGFREAHVGSTRGSSWGRAGYTIVEVIIVLAVSSAMFLTAILLVNGRQNRTQFMTAINGLQQQVQQLINETQSNYYPNAGNFSCHRGNTQPVTFTNDASNVTQGLNGGCIFLGKAVQFGTDVSGSQLAVLPIVGNQFIGSSAEPVETLAQSLPRALYPATADGSFVPDASELHAMENSLTVASSNSACGAGNGGMCYVDQATGVVTKTGIIAIMAGNSSGVIAPTSGGKVTSGSMPVSLYGVDGSTPNNSMAAASTAIGGAGSGPYTYNLSAAKTASICIASGTTSNEFGVLSIDNSLHVTLTIKQGVASC